MPQPIQDVPTRPAGADYPRTVVPKGHCFVLPDNRNSAKDSRTFGPVPIGDVIGRADHIYFPRWQSLRPDSD